MKKRKKDIELVKSNTLLISNLTSGLNKKQIQLLTYALYILQQKNTKRLISEFSLVDFRKQFGIKERNDYNKKDIAEDLMKLRAIHLMSFDNEYFLSDYLDEGEFSDEGVIYKTQYKNGNITIEWIENETNRKRVTGASEEITKYSLETLAKLGEKGWVLYELITLLNQQGVNELHLTLNDLANIYKIKGKNVDNFYYINKRYLEPAVDEINKNHTDFYVAIERIKSGRKNIGAILTWTSQKKANSVTESQLKTIKELLVEFEQYNQYYIDDKEYQSLYKTIKNYKEYSSNGIFPYVQSALNKINRVKKEVNKIKFTNYELLDVTPYDGYFRAWKEMIKADEKAEFVELAERFSDSERKELLLKAINIAKDRGVKRFSYVIQILRDWQSRGIQTTLEAEEVYNNVFGGYEYNYKKGLKENPVTVSPEFLEAMDLWSD